MQMDDKREWVQVYETTQMHLALMVQELLREHNMEAVILNQKDSLYVTLGEAQVYVPLEQSADAIILIDKEME